MIRNLKYYKWVFDEKTNLVCLVDKRLVKTLVLNMTMVDSFVRAYIGFKTRQRTSEKRVLKEKHQKRIEKMLVQIEQLKDKLKEGI